MTADIGNGSSNNEVDVDASFIDAGGGIADASPPDAPPPDARACIEGDQRTEGADGTCYFRFDTPASWPNARQLCIDNGGDLARIDDSAENDLVFALARQAPTVDDWWVGANDRVSEGQWVWQDDNVLIVQCDAAQPPNCTFPGTLFEQFRIGEPNNGDQPNGEDCMILETDTAAKTWDDRNCDLKSFPFVCERAP